MTDTPTTDETIDQTADHLYRFASNLIAPVLNEEKTATIRYDDERNPEPGDTIAAQNQSGETFARLSITDVHNVRVGGITGYLNQEGVQYGASSVEEVLDDLNEHYADHRFRITRWTMVRMIVFNIDEEVDTDD